MRIGMLGCGNIGTFLLQSLNNKKTDEKIVAIHSRNVEKTAEIAKQYGASSYETLESFLETDLELVVEVATIEVVRQATLPVLQKGIPLIISSIGAFSNIGFLNEVKQISSQYN